MEPVWSVWARELQATAQTGLTFARSKFDRERYKAIRTLAARMMTTYSDANFARISGLRDPSSRRTERRSQFHR
jgi:hypothetical protein